MDTTLVERVQRESEYAELRIHLTSGFGGSVGGSRAQLWEDSDTPQLKPDDMRLIEFVFREMLQSTRGQMELKRLAEMVGVGDPTGLPALVVRGLDEMEAKR